MGPVCGPVCGCSDGLGRLDRRDGRQHETIAERSEGLPAAAVRTLADRRGQRQRAIRANGGDGFERRVRGGRRPSLQPQTGRNAAG
jgi:hypothetical protein